MQRTRRGERQLGPGPALDLVDLLRLLTARSALSNAEIARRSGYAASFVSEVRRGWKVPSRPAAEAIAGACKASAADIDKLGRLAELVSDAQAERRRQQSGKVLLADTVDSVLRAGRAEGLFASGQDGEDSPVRRALELVIGQAIMHYAIADGRLEIARPLLRAPVFLAEPGVAAEVLRALVPGMEPDAEAVGRRWQVAMDDAAQVRNFAAEAAALLECISDQAGEAGLRIWLTPVGQAGAGGDHTQMAHQVSELRQGLAGIAALLGSGPASSLPTSLRMYIIDQTQIIADSTAGFIGRGALLAEIDELVRTRDRAYCHVLAHPGVGKTALLAKLVQSKGYVHHFNVRTAGIVTPQAFLGNVCARLIGAYKLPHISLRPDATQNGGYLTTLLAEIADRLRRKVVIVVDALDESDFRSLLPGTNPLYLPASPPPGVIFIVSSRPADDVVGAWRPPGIQADCEQVTIVIDHLGAANMADVREFIGRWATRRGVSEYRSRHGYDVSDLVERLAQRSEGNFMYLHHVLPAIDRGEIRDTEISELPQGLYQYYSDQLERMRGENADAWYAYKLPVLTAFCALRGTGPLTARDIARASGIADIARVKDTLREWRAFLAPVPLTDDGVTSTGYRLYHAKFEDFVCDEIG